jgi:hypothetical protein
MRVDRMTFWMPGEKAISAFRSEAETNDSAQYKRKSQH